MNDDEKIKKTAENIIISEYLEQGGLQHAKYYVSCFNVNYSKTHFNDETIYSHVDFNDYVTAYVYLQVTPKFWENILRRAKLVAFL